MVQDFFHQPYVIDPFTVRHTCAVPVHAYNYKRLGGDEPNLPTRPASRLWMACACAACACVCVCVCVCMCVSARMCACSRARGGILRTCERVATVGSQTFAAVNFLHPVPVFQCSRSFRRGRVLFLASHRRGLQRQEPGNAERMTRHSRDHCCARCCAH